MSKKPFKKTKVEIQSIVVDQSQIEELKNQEQAIITELDWWETKDKNLDELLANLAEVEKFSTEFLAEVVNQKKENLEIECWEQSIKDKTEFSLKFEADREAFYQLVWQKIEFKVCQLKAQRNNIQDQLLHQERIFARIEIRRQGRVLLECKSGYRLGCPGVYQCDNCKVNYSAIGSIVADNNQATEMRSIPRGQISQ